MKHTITKNGIEFEIDLTADKYNQLHVTARTGSNTETGKIGSAGGRIYPRIDFMFVQKSQWLIRAADHKYWGEDDDTSRDLPQSCEFSISQSDLNFIQKWAVLIPPKPGFNPNALIVLKTGTDGICDEKKSFDTIDELRTFLTGRGINLSDVQCNEIMRSRDTQFNNSEMISDDGISGYFGVRRYEIEVRQ